MKKLLALCRYGSSAASTRQRLDQYIPFLQVQDIAVEKRPLFDDSYFVDIQSRKNKPAFRIAKGYARRIWDLVRDHDADVLLVMDELFPYLPFAAEKLVLRTKKPLLLDIDDAIFHRYENIRSPIIRNLLTSKFPKLFREASAISCGNKYLEEFSSNFCSHTELIPTVVDTDKYLPAMKSKSGGVCIGWIGSPATWNYVLPYLELFDRIVGQNNVRFLAIGAPFNQAPRKNYEFRKWSVNTEIADIQEIDIGIMPLPNNNWTRGKCGYKLIQYMACGIPVIATPIGVNTEIVRDGINGRLATSIDEWRRALHQLNYDAALRRRWGESGREHIISKYSLKTYGPIFAKLVRGLIEYP